jgi:hypothetical protein
MKAALTANPEQNSRRRIFSPLTVNVYVHEMKTLERRICSHLIYCDERGLLNAWQNGGNFRAKYSDFYPLRSL